MKSSDSSKYNTLNFHTTDYITSLPLNTIFVFGSNLSGIHGAGAALIAKQKFGATPGIGNGLANNSYAIPTKDEKIKTLSLEEIQNYIDDFLLFCKNNTDKTFFLTKIGCGLAGYNERQICSLFINSKEIFNLDNIIYPSSFKDILHEEVYCSNT
jgi:hypothetical protein